MYNEFSKPTIEIDLYDNSVYINNIIELCNISEVKNIILNTNNIRLYEKVTSNIYSNANIFSPINNLHILDTNNPDFNIREDVKVIVLRVPFASDINIQHLENVLDRLNEMLNNNTVLLEFKNKNEDFNVPTYNRLIELVHYKIGKLYFGALFKSTALIIEHPCNAYVCNGHNCHSKKSSFPRYLYITEKGIDPYKSYNEDLIFMKNISFIEYQEIENYFENEYIKTSEYINFINKNKEIFNNYIINPIVAILPWNILMN